MALLSKEKSGREWDMAFFDEITGALDSKGAADSFMKMYAPFMKIGGIRQLFFITHQNECLSYADHVLRFEAGKCPAWG
jgi:ABC-type lipoprotein export system ATPase subunit